MSAASSTETFCSSASPPTGSHSIANCQPHPILLHYWHFLPPPQLLIMSLLLPPVALFFWWIPPHIPPLLFVKTGSWHGKSPFKSRSNVDWPKFAKTCLLDCWKNCNQFSADACVAGTMMTTSEGAVPRAPSTWLLACHTIQTTFWSGGWHLRTTCAIQLKICWGEQHHGECLIYDIACGFNVRTMVSWCFLQFEWCVVDSCGLTNGWGHVKKGCKLCWWITQ